LDEQPESALFASSVALTRYIEGNINPGQAVSHLRQSVLFKAQLYHEWLGENANEEDICDLARAKTSDRLKTSGKEPAGTRYMAYLEDILIQLLTS